jgi:thiosulfate reductase cytochrome b subunit
MSATTTHRIYLYKRYERFWHWSQAALVIFMLITGFEVHGSFSNFGFRRATELHTYAAWALLTLWAFTIFWQFTTGEWRQYIPTLNKVLAMVRYYSYGIFVHAPHPFQKTASSKHNPLQRLAYVALLAMISPLIWVSGLFYVFYAYWRELGIDRWLSLEAVAWAHTAGAFMMLAFFIVHVYLTTTGHTITAHIKTMITGWEEEEIPVEPATTGNATQP